MDLFQSLGDKELQTRAPLASKMRPESLVEIVGQEHILGRGKLLRRAIEADRLGSIILYGYPGTGKTTIARVIAKTTKSFWTQLNAVTSGIADIKKVIQESEERLKYHQKATILFIDEIHRFNKTQQDALLPAVEEGKVTLIGATTENPYFAVNSALVSRSLVFRLELLSQEQIKELLEKALVDKERGLGIYKVEISQEALNHLALACGGDARIALNALELAVLSTAPNNDGIRIVDIKAAEESIQRRSVVYDKSGDQHYDVISAFIKSMRGSDPDGTLHYLARMIDAGEDPRFIARRIVIHASEDVGMADPLALVVAQSAATAVAEIGMPEGRLILAQAALHIALSPKNNSVLGINKALSDVKTKNIGQVPLHLRDAHYSGAKVLGHGIEYKYPHDFPKAQVSQQYLPDELVGTKYYIEKEDN